MHFSMTKPCHNCPFREDVTFYLDPRRARDILHAILEEDQTFTCHNTLDCTQEDGEGDALATGHEQHCAGALILAERLERPNQMMRIAERLGLYHRHKLDMDAPVFTTPKAMLARMQALARTPRRQP